MALFIAAVDTVEHLLCRGGTPSVRDPDVGYKWLEHWAEWPLVTIDRRDSRIADTTTAWLRAIHNPVLIVPADPLETEQAVQAAHDYDGPVFIRVSRQGVLSVYPADYRFEIGRAVRLVEGADITLIAHGRMVSRALDAADRLAADGISARVVSMPTVKPLDTEEVVAAAVDTGAIVTVEEHTVHGGLGGAVAETVVAERPVPMRILGIPGFAPTGSAPWLLDHFGLNALGIHAAAHELLGRKQA